MHKDLRLTAAPLFKRVYKEGKPLVTKELVLYFIYLGDRDASRFGFSVSKKVGKAVLRNKLRRRLRNIIGSRAEQIKAGYLAVFVIRPAAAGSTFAQIESVVGFLLNKAGMTGGGT